MSEKPNSSTARLQSWQMLGNPQTGRVVAYWLLAIMVCVVAIGFLPWQQTVRGAGVVTAFRPQDRPQSVVSTIAGRIEEWYVQEGQYVEKGDSIMRISEVKDQYFDPLVLQRYQQQLQATQRVFQATQAQVDALDQLLASLDIARDTKLEQTRNKLQQARLYVEIDSANLEAARLDYTIAQRQFEGMEALYRQGLEPLVKYEERKGKLQQAEAKLAGAQSKYETSQNEFINAQIEIARIQAEYQKEIAKAQSDRAAKLAYLNEVSAKLAKLENDLANLEVRMGYYVIRAPQSGYVVKALKSGIGEQVKEQEQVVTVMPSNPQLAVELYVSATDITLLAPGRPVRLEFDGFPGIQVSGWPSASVGTFGGRVQVVDYVNSANGKYRVLVTPDPEEEPWPETTSLRPGTGVKGWTLLDRVRVWYEVWRQLNGFPPNFVNDQTMPGGSGSKAKSVAPEVSAGKDK